MTATITDRACDYARVGLRVFPVVMNGDRPKEPPYGYMWKARASSQINHVVEDFTEVIGNHGENNVGIAWALGLDGYVALDLDADEPDWWADIEKVSAVNHTRRGRHTIAPFPEGMVPGNGVSKFPTGGWGEVRGVGGYIVIDADDRPGFDAAQLDGLAPFPHPEWLTESGDTSRAASDDEVDAFLAAHLSENEPTALGIVQAFLEKWTPGGTRSNGDKMSTARHDTAIEVACWIARDAAAGQYAADRGFGELRAWWLHVINGERDANGRELDSIISWAIGQVPKVVEVEPPPVTPITLDQAHAVARKWLGDEYDLDALDVTLIAAAVERLEGDPLWLLVISGSGNAKTETVQALGDLAHVTSTITSVGALLSASPKKEKASDATGGLLRKIGDSGVLVIKDVTSILSMDRNGRAEVLAALREVYDGYWERNVGTDGGRTLTWKGRIAVIGAVTTAWDRAHDVISAMGDRFVLLRMDSNVGRLAAGRRSIGNTGHEVEMRAELCDAVAGVLAGVDPARAVELNDIDGDRLLMAADIVTRGRTAVDFDYRGDVIDAHAPEMPTRFAKQLAQVVRGGLAIGLDHDQSMRLAIRCARDSMPPLRLAILLDVTEYPGSTTTQVRKRIAKPRATVDRQLQSLHMLELLECIEDDDYSGRGSSWRYSLAEGVDPDVLTITRFVSEYAQGHKKEREETLSPTTHISGDGPPLAADPLRCLVCGQYEDGLLGCACPEVA